MSAIDKLVKQAGDELGYRLANELNRIVLQHYQELLREAYDELECINSQWQDKGLPGDFFCLPVDLEELVARLGKAVF